MLQKLQKLNHLELQAANIQYLPEHKCPQCGAPPMTNKDGSWFTPFQDWYRTPLSNWVGNLGYVGFQCFCVHHPEFRHGSLRVARLGDAIIPVQFDDGRLARQVGMEPAWINADRVRQAVAFLAQQADARRTSGSDYIAHLLYALSAGMLGPDVAANQLRQWIQDENLAATLTTFQVAKNGKAKVLDPAEW